MDGAPDYHKWIRESKDGGSAVNPSFQPAAPYGIRVNTGQLRHLYQTDLNIWNDQYISRSVISGCFEAIVHWSTVAAQSEPAKFCLGIRQAGTDTVLARIDRLAIAGTRYTYRYRAQDDGMGIGNIVVTNAQGTQITSGRM